MSTTTTITGNENMPVYLGLAVVVIIVIAYFSKSDEDASKKSKAVAAAPSVAAQTNSSKKSKKKNKPKAKQQAAATTSTPPPAEEKKEDKPKSKKKKTVTIQEEPTPVVVDEPETKSSAASKKKKKKKKKKGGNNNGSDDTTSAPVSSPKTVIENNNNTSDDESEDSDDDELWRIQSASKRKGSNDIAKRAAANKERDRVRALKRQEEKVKADAKAKADAEQAAALEAEEAAAAAKAEELARKEEEEKAKAAAKEAEAKNNKNGESTTAADGSAAPTGEKKKRKRKKKKGGAAANDEGATRPTLVSGPPPVEHWETVPVEEEWQEVGKKSKPKVPTNNNSAPTSSSTGGGNNNGAANGGSVDTPSLSDEPVVLEEQSSVTLPAGDDPLIFIGKGGATIQHLEESTGCQFHLNRSTNILTISGTEDAVQIGLAKAQSILTEAEERKANQVEEKVTWGSDAIKAVIGRGGVNIRASEEATGARIDADVGEGTLVIVGSTDQVKAALTMCHNIAFGEVQEVLELGSRNAVNLVYGPNFTTIRSLQDSTGCRLDITRGSTTLKMAGSAEAVATAKARISALLASNQGFSMTIENSKVGAVYGKGGETLRSIQDRTGTQIDVSRGPTHATVSVMGTAESTARARNMLQRAIDGDVEVKAGEVAEEIELGNATAAVIGRGGSNVAELEKRHGVKINVRSELQKARVVGKPSMVEAAVKDINTIVKPILAAESAQKKADEEVQTGESAWQGDDTAEDDEAEGW